VPATPAVVDRGSAGDLNFRIVDITLSGSDYAAGGWTITPQALGFGANGVIYQLEVGPKGGFLFEWNQATGKLMARDSSGGVGAATPETANSLAALNGIVIRGIAWGKGHG
jgi:hypothetical protein